MQPNFADIASEAWQRESIRSPLLQSIAGLVFSVTLITQVLVSPPEPIEIAILEPSAETLAEMSETDMERYVEDVAVLSADAESSAELEASLHEDVPKVETVEALPEVISQTLAVKSGGSFTSLLTRADASSREAYAIINALKKVFDMRSLKAGQKVTVTQELASDGVSYEVSEIAFKPSRAEQMRVVRTDNNNFTAYKDAITFDRELVYAGGVVNSSLLGATGKAGVPQKLAIELINAYKYDVDFQRQIRPGDGFSIVYEKFLTKEGEFSHIGKIIYADLKLQGKSHELYRFARKGESAEYYNNKGMSVRKDMLRTPISGARISSGFGQRHHPILGYNKMHKGIDFAASTGTPIVSAGNGVVDYVGRKGGYGRYIRIRHNNTFSTAYAHLSRFKKNLRRGQKVAQGEVIGYVGTSGRSTGPHLHYEVLQNGAQINPQRYIASSNHKLAGNDMKRFKALQSEMHQFANNQKNSVKLAMR